jgi:carbon-monoxide dehydrogenase large subunit
MTYPFGTYIVVVEVDTGIGKWEVRRMVAVDDCGVRINASIAGGADPRRAHRGVLDGEHAVHHLIPTVYETPRFELGETVTPSPHHPIGAKGVTNIDMPVLPHRVWGAIQEARR